MLPPVQVSQTPESKFREYLASRPRPQRYTTPQREMVRFIFSSHNHFDADRLCEDLERSGLNISRATVYRTLGKLVDAGLLRRLDFGPRVIYEHDYGYPQHDHLHCEKCGRLIEFSADMVKEIRAAVAREHRFRVSHHRFIISGVCAECSRPERRNRRLDLV